MYSRTAPNFVDWIESGDEYPLDPEDRDYQLANSCVILDSDSGNELRWRNFYCQHYRALPICEADMEVDDEDGSGDEVLDADPAVRSPSMKDLPAPFL